MVSDRSQRLFVVLCAVFLAHALLAEFVGVKIFALEPTLGLRTFDWHLFGQRGTLDFTAGVLLWPAVFVLTDVINEYFGRRGVRFISWVTALLIVYAFAFAWIAIQLAPAGWWVGAMSARGVPDQQAAYAVIFGQGMWTIGGSLVAFLLGQFLDVSIFHRIRRLTGERKLWLRATVSTLFSQLVDSFLVLYVAFVLGPQQWSMQRLYAIGSVNYTYKVLAAIALIPVIYLLHGLIERWLGRGTANRMKLEAARA